MHNILDKKVIFYTLEKHWEHGSPVANSSLTFSSNGLLLTTLPTVSHQRTHLCFFPVSW